MLISHFLWPDVYVPDITYVTPGLLEELGIRALICDIDNTLVTYDDPVPTPAASEWFASMSKAGIKLALVSNNTPGRVNAFAAACGLYASSESRKPVTREVKRAMKHLGVSRRECAVLGDQLFTDVCCGRFAGLRAILVDPIRDRLTPAFRFKRALERPILRVYRRRAARRFGGFYYLRKGY